MSFANSRIIFLVAALMAAPSLAHADGVGYPSAQAAWDAVSVKPGVQVQVMKDWRVLVDDESKISWTFTNPGTPAYPSVVKRIVSEKNGAVYVEMKILCHSIKSECDHLRDQFVEMDENLKQSIAAGRQGESR